MNIEQEARDLLNAVSQERAGYDTAAAHDNREESFSLEAVWRALEARNEVQAAFDAYRREVAEAVYNYFQHSTIEDEKRLCRFINSEPVDPLTVTLDELGVNRADFDAALAKIGGRVMFGEI